MEKPVQSAKPGMPSLVEREPSATLSMFPTMNELLTNANWPDLTPKGKLCLMVFITETTVRVLIKLEDLCLKTSLAAHTLDDALALLEKLLASNQVVWESDRPHDGGGKKKGK